MEKDKMHIFFFSSFLSFFLSLSPQAISDVIEVKFRLYTVPDNLYGFYNHETGDWNGIVRQLTDKRADLAVASMTINYARETVIDFTKPFMNLGISILFKAPKDPATEVSADELLIVIQSLGN